MRRVGAGQVLRRRSSWETPARAALPAGRGYLRRSRPYRILGLVLLLAFAVAVEHWLERRAANPSMRRMTIVAAGESGEYAGATWRLTRLGPGSPRRAVPLPDDAVVVYAGLTVTPHDAAASDRIEACVLRAVDGRGRTWGPASVLIADAGRGADSAAGCYRPTGGYEREPIPAGRSQRILTAFLVPKDVLPDLAVRVLVRGAAPRYLQFEL